MVLPDQRVAAAHLAVAAGKFGLLYIIDHRFIYGQIRRRRPRQAAKRQSITWCHYGPSYFVGSDSVPRVVSSSGTVVKTWKVDTSNPVPLTLELRRRRCSSPQSSRRAASRIPDSSRRSRRMARRPIPRSSGRYRGRTPTLVPSCQPVRLPIRHPRAARCRRFSRTSPGSGRRWAATPTLYRLSPTAGSMWPSYKQLTVFGLAPTRPRIVKPKQLVVAVAAAVPAAATAPAAAGAHVVENHRQRRRQPDRRALAQQRQPEGRPHRRAQGQHRDPAVRRRDRRGHRHHGGRRAAGRRPDVTRQGPQ